MNHDISKKEIALIQLRRAIQLFMNDEYICAATLSGAAEEILGKIAKSNSGYNALDEWYSSIEEVASLTGGKPITFKQHIEKRNRIRNELKHNKKGKNLKVDAYLKIEAEDLIERALINYLLAFGEEPKDRIIKKYINLFHK